MVHNAGSGYSDDVCKSVVKEGPNLDKRSDAKKTSLCSLEKKRHSKICHGHVCGGELAYPAVNTCCHHDTSIRAM